MKGVKLVGPLPRRAAEIHGLRRGAKRETKQATVKEFIAHLTSAQARSRLAQAGYTAPE